MSHGRELLEPGVARGQWWHRIDDGRVACDLCPRACLMKDGQRGFCFVREARDGEMALTSYGRASGFCVDPIEKKPLNHFYPGTSVLSFGTAGCNLGCRFCQNWDISKAREMDRLGDAAPPDAVARAAVDAGCRSIAFTYNDPVIFAEYVIDCAAAAHERSLKTVAVTAGYISASARADFFKHIDAANVDLKAFSQRFYGRLCAADLSPVLDTLAWLATETDVWLEITTLLIPGENDSDTELARMCEWLVEHVGIDVPLHFSAFHPDYRMTDLERTPTTTLSHARELATSAGLRHVYTGNVHDPAGQSTYCAECHAVLIERNWYELGEWNLDGYAGCVTCGAHLAGHFDAGPGTWGSQRRHLRVG